MIRITFILGGWSPNIGNAFFQLSGYHLFKTILPVATFSIINEKQATLNIGIQKGGIKKDISI